MLKKSVVLTAGLALTLFTLVVADHHDDMKHEKPDLPTECVAVLTSTSGSDVKGTIVLKSANDQVSITGKITGLKPGEHGFHIHEFGDLRDPAGKSAGGHFNPTDDPHGGPKAEKHHAGDFGNITANSDGVANLNIRADWLKLHFVIGRAIVVHGGTDDLKSQPSGDAGDRVAVGVIGIAKGSPSNTNGG